MRPASAEGPVGKAELVSKATITSHADNLLLQLSWERPTIQSNTRIVFIGHSLGGLVIKQALLNAQRNRNYESILKSTFGLAFFAVPHRGSNLGKTVSALVRSLSGANADNKILESLETNSLFTKDMIKQYRYMLENYRIVSFYEQMDTPLFGRAVAIVGEESAVLDLPGTRELQVAVTDADHSSICKIAGKGNMYKIIMRSITGHITDQAIEAVQSYVPPPSISPLQNIQPPRAGPSLLASNSLATATPPAPVTGTLYLPNGTSEVDLNLAEHKNMGQWDKAVALENSIFQERQRTLSAEHPSTIETACNLAYSFCQAGKPNDASSWIDWVLKTSRRVLGDEHQLSLKAEALTSAVLSLRGEPEKAEAVCVGVLMRQQDQLGEDHADTLETQGLLGEISYQLGRKEEGCERLFSWAQHVEKVFGENHLKAHSASLTWLEAKYPMDVGQFSISRIPPVIKRSVTTLHRDISNACSQYHPLAIYCIRLLGKWQACEGQYVESSDTLRRALATAEKGLGGDHPETIQVVLCLGQLFCKRNMWKEAAPFYERYAEWISGRRGNANRENLDALEALGQLYLGSKEWSKAETTFQKLLAAASGVDNRVIQEAENKLQQLALINGKRRNRGGIFGF
ncbi:hypothetical protein VE00_03128 [Pseudogymnoascus sp. WSF 3629]|nr:hypothetical protein VE00_03128 [Pseudogymnoascus sp. WSF 3629]